MNRKKKSIKVLFILNIGSGNDAILLIHKSPTYHTIFLPHLGKFASGFGILGFEIMGFEILESGIQHKEYRIQLSTTMSYGKRVSRG